MERAEGIRPEQKRVFYQLMLTLLVGTAVALSLHKPALLMNMLICSWGVSIFSLGRPGYIGITRGVLFMGVLCYVMYRFVFHDA
jgi:hypothetical protein